MIPLSPTSCEFGKWLYSEGVKYKVFTKLSNQINEIEREHTELHELYFNIYTIYFAEKKRNILRNFVLGKDQKISDKDKKYTIMKSLNLFLKT